MGILDGIVEWIAEQVMNALDLITTSVLGALGCNMDTFLRYFPAAETMYRIFVATAIGLILLNWIWQLFKKLRTDCRRRGRRSVQTEYPLFFIYRTGLLL